MAGLAARDAAAEELDGAPDIRWPNDLLVGGRKFAGILTEMHAEPDRIHYAVVGIGINVNQTKMPRGTGGDRHVAADRDEERRIRASSCWSGCCATSTATTISSSPRARRRSCGGSREVSSYFEGKRVRITTSTESFTGTTAGWSRAACCAWRATTDADRTRAFGRRGGGGLMLLTLDVGNTNTVLGVFRGKELVAHWRLTTARDQTVDEYGILTRDLFTLAELEPEGDQRRDHQLGGAAAEPDSGGNVAQVSSAKNRCSSSRG